MKKKIGVFGGSFDPIHMGHINLAMHLSEQIGLDQVLFCPAKISPFKVKTPPIVSYDQRCLMVEQALEGIDNFFLTRVDEHRQAPSFMIDTLIDLKKTYVNDTFFLMLASDAYLHFSQWKQASRILSMATLLVGTRLGFEAELESKKECLQAKQCHMPPMDISSKNLRCRLKEKLYCGHQIPSKVLDFIYENRLYYP
ncbi:nicotinate (nicotinamide) nucleotide adenylyltransferase [Candidatus Aerophobetes bacterium]|uniref:Probable nicotinate-nucleotide adenylyltransferase n=1 Tax=Aerophobetes bacterium TaxID=2030807 RepID=A0A2A4X0H6_UNCAE|nr:MAG: nicotinate (nicotinamide) nucleotide adenylyltransferase [Candidatus Aerophobetes bacterium]